jgi:hypothetical protein
VRGLMIFLRAAVSSSLWLDHAELFWVNKNFNCFWFHLFLGN